MLAEGEGRADVFLLAPSVDTKDEDNMSLSDEDNIRRFKGALEMQRGIYEEGNRLFAPFYRQASMRSQSEGPDDERRPSMLAYSDVSAAFRYYLDNYNEGRPIILAGFSQGSQMCCRILTEYFGDSRLYDRLIATYSIGWPCTRDMVSKYPQIVPAQGEDDTGVLIAFDCESADLEESYLDSKGRWSHSINPLNWRTDGTVAGRDLNKGCRIMRSNGEVKAEIPNFCGCYIEPERGVLKVIGPDPKDYKPLIPELPYGGYHVYDFEFFYYNLKENVKRRSDSYFSKIQRI